MTGVIFTLLAFVSDNERAKGTRKHTGVNLSGTPILRPCGGAFRLFSAKAGEVVPRVAHALRIIKKAVAEIANREPTRAKNTIKVPERSLKKRRCRVDAR